MHENIALRRPSLDFSCLLCLLCHSGRETSVKVFRQNLGFGGRQSSPSSYQLYAKFTFLTKLDHNNYVNYIFVAFVQLRYIISLRFGFFKVIFMIECF